MGEGLRSIIKCLVEESNTRGISILRIEVEGLSIGVISGSVRSYEELIELVVGVGARLIAEAEPSIGLVGLVRIGTIITSSSATGSLDTGTRKRLSRSISDGSIRGIIRSIFSILILDYPSYYIIISLSETSSCLLSTISLVVSPTRFIREAILRRLLL